MNKHNVEGYILGELSDLLECHLDQHSIDTSFHELGMDSLIGIRLVGRLADTVGQEIDPLVVFDYPSIRELSGFITEQYDYKVTSSPVLSY